MFGLARSEANSCANPRLTFVYQANGRLADLNGLRFSVWDLTPATPVEVVANTVVTLTACPGGQRVGLGRYVANFTPGGAWNLGTHEVRWLYRAVATDPERLVRTPFEVLDPVTFASTLPYFTYASSRDAQTLGMVLTATLTVTRLQQLLWEASQEVDLYTNRWFDPRYNVLRVDGPGHPTVDLEVPIVGIEELVVESGGAFGATTDTPADLTQVRIYNRHLTQGLTAPDDREQPRITSVDDLTRFGRGKQNVRITGVYGYTEPDGTPVGRTPLLLTRATAMIAQRRNLDALATDPWAQPGRIRSARTRDQAITFFGPNETGQAAAWTGEAAVDTILARFAKAASHGATTSWLETTQAR